MIHKFEQAQEALVPATYMANYKAKLNSLNTEAQKKYAESFA